MKGLMISLVVSLVANMGGYLAVKYYRGQAQNIADQCALDKATAAADASQAAREALQDAHAIERAELEARLRLERRATEKLNDLAVRLGAEKQATEKRLRDAMAQVDNRDWGDVLVPIGLLDAAQNRDETGNSSGAGDSEGDAAGSADDSLFTTRVHGGQQLRFAARLDRGT